MISIHTNVANLSHFLEPSESRFCDCWIRLWSEKKISIISTSLDWWPKSRSFCDQGPVWDLPECHLWQSEVRSVDALPIVSTPDHGQLNHGAKMYSHTDAINTVNTDAETHTICQLLIMGDQYFQQRYVCKFWLNSIRIKDEIALKIGLDIDLKYRH